MAAWNVALTGLLLALAFAGCVGEPDEEPRSETPRTVSGSEVQVPLAPAEEPSPTPTTGSLAGEVVDVDLQPVPGAFVMLATDGAERAARTDAEGRFTINDLAPGWFPVQVSALGFGTASEMVEIVAGEVTQHPFIVQAHRIAKPYSVPLEMRGFMAAGYAAMDGELAGTPDLTDPNHDTDHPFDVNPEGLETLIVEIYWDQRQTGLAVDLWKNVTCNPCDAVYKYANEAGFGSIKFRLDRPEGGWEGMDSLNETLWLFVWPTSDDQHPATVTYQLAYDVYIEVFYHERAPFNYSVRGDH